MNILIAGGTGSIGRTLINCSNDDHNWIIISRNKCKDSGYNCITEKLFLDGEYKIDYGMFILSIGSGKFKPISEIEENDLKRAYEDNLEKPFLYLKSAIEYFIQKGGGNIIVINSLSAIYPYRNGAAYAPFKSALSMLVKIARKENKIKKIKIGQIFLPPIESPMVGKIPNKIADGLMNKKELIKVVDDMINKCENRDIVIKRKIRFA